MTNKKYEVILLWVLFYAVVRRRLMNKAGLVEEVRKILGCTRSEAKRGVAAVVEAIARGLKRDKSVQILGFGHFMVRRRKKRTLKNPKTGEKITVKAWKTVTFRPAKALKERVKR